MLKTSQFTVHELNLYYFNDETLFFTSSSVQQLNLSPNAGYYFTKVATVKDFCPRGRFHAYTAATANNYMKQFK